MATPGWTWTSGGCRKVRNYTTPVTPPACAPCPTPPTAAGKSETSSSASTEVNDYMEGGAIDAAAALKQATQKN
jgi:hypothetical protein